jgi:hypothetical protein
MGQKRHTPEQIIGKLGECEIELGSLWYACSSPC